MKYCPFLSCILLSTLVFAQGDDRTAGNGTTFTYNVKDGKISYKLKATIKQWNWDTIKFQWQSYKPKAAKGSVTMMFSAIGEGKSIKIKPKAGNIILADDVCSLVLPYNIFDSLFNMQYNTSVVVDGRFEKLDPVKTEENHPLKYNNEVHKVMYGEGYNDKEGKNKLKLGFIEYMNDIIIVAKYVNGNYSMELESVTSPQRDE